MNPTISKSRQLDIVRNGQRPDHEIFAAVLRKWRRKLGYCSVVAAVPAVLASNLPVTRSDAAKKPEVNVPRPGPRLRERWKMDLVKRALLERQSEFRLPHQKGDLTPLSLPDDCPGRPIPGGTYTAASPFVDSGNTSGANNTVDALPSYYYYYYNYSAHGPDHIYSFTLTGRGANPQIRVTTTSGTYHPMIYVLRGSDGGGCPAGTGNQPPNVMAINWGEGNSATFDKNYLGSFPLNEPLYLFIDSPSNDSSTGAGPYQISMQDITIGCANGIDCTDFFVRQQYRDFLNRDPDANGLNFWVNEIMNCGSDPQCIDLKRVNDSGAFFLSIEFQESGYLAYRFHKAAFGSLPGAPVPVRFSDFVPDAQQIGKDVIVNKEGWQAVLESNKQSFANDFVQRSRFTATYDTALSPDTFVDMLFANAHVTPEATDRDAAINEFGGATNTSNLAARGRALRRVAENQRLYEQEFRNAFVLMQYFGYLRRNPDDAPDSDFSGFRFWLAKLDEFRGDFSKAEMVKAFISSTEYRKRFGS